MFGKYILGSKQFCKISTFVISFFVISVSTSDVVRKSNCLITKNILKKRSNLSKLLIKVMYDETIRSISFPSSTNHFRFFMGQSVSFHEVFEPYYPWFIVAKLPSFNLVSMYAITNNLRQKRQSNNSRFLYKLC